MANNRMWLKNKKTGKQLLIAKYYPSTGWGVFYKDFQDQGNKLFHDNTQDFSTCGDNDWFIEYETNIECDHVMGLSEGAGIESWLTYESKYEEEKYYMGEKFKFCPLCGVKL